MEDDKDKSKFNAGVAKLERINGVKTRLINAAMLDDEQGKIRLLECYRTELNERLNSIERGNCDKYERKINHLFKSNPNCGGWDINYLDKELKEYERYLNDLEYKYGLSMPDEDEDEGL